MTSNIRALGLAIVLSAIAACTTAPTYDDYMSAIPPASSGNGRIYVYRVGNEGVTIRPQMLLDGEPVGRAIPSGFFYLDRPAGNYEFSPSTVFDRTLVLRLRMGEELFIRVHVNLTQTSWHVIPTLVDADVAKQELQRTKFTGSM